MTKCFLVSGWAAGAGIFPDCDCYVAVEGGEEVRDAFEGESGEAVVCEGGDFGLVDVERGGGGSSSVPTGRGSVFMRAVPALKRRAIFGCPYGTARQRG